MNDDTDNFFIENCPQGNPEKWIESFVYTKSDVEYVDVYELGKMLEGWTNPNSSSEEN